VRKNAKTQTRPQGRSAPGSPGLPCEQHGPVQSGGRAGGAKASNGTKDAPEQTEPARNVYVGRIMGRSPDIKTFASAGCQYCFGAATDKQGNQGIYIDVGSRGNRLTAAPVDKHGKESERGGAVYEINTQNAGKGNFYRANFKTLGLPQK